MADASGQALIRGIDIDKVAKGYAEEEIKLKRFVNVSPTSAREIRWYQKTSGFLDSVDTTGITASQIANTSSKSRPVVVEQSWTRQTSYVRSYFVESPFFSDEDIKDSDVDILLTNVRDLVRAVEHQVDLRIYSVLSSASGNTSAVVIPWDSPAISGATIINDIMTAKTNIRQDAYDPEGAVLLVNSYDHQQIVNWLISTKGASIPQFASDKVETGVVMNLLGLKVVVDENVTADEAMVFIPNRTCTWKSFRPITSVVIEDKLIGQKIRVKEEGEAIVTDPNSLNKITNTRI